MSSKAVGSLIKGVVKKAKKRKPAVAGGALFKQEGASVKNKSRLAEDSDVLAGKGPRRKEAEKIEKEDIVENPVPKGQASAMKDVREGRAGKVAGGSEDKVMVNVAGKRKGMQAEMTRTMKKIENNESKLKKLQADLKAGRGSRVKVFEQFENLKEKLKLDKEKLGGKKGMQKRSPPPDKKAYGGKVTKRKYGGNMSKPKSKKIIYKRGGGMIGNKGLMYGYKSGGQV